MLMKINFLRHETRLSTHRPVKWDKIPWIYTAKPGLTYPRTRKIFAPKPLHFNY